MILHILLAKIEFIWTCCEWSLVSISFKLSISDNDFTEVPYKFKWIFLWIAETVTDKTIKTIDSSRV